jgi:hypothetical protein
MQTEEQMERISLVQLESALIVASEPLPNSLSNEELSELALLTAQMVQRYPSQDTEVSVEGYLVDFEQLALKHSLTAVKNALGQLRIKPGQQFFPRPDEVATEIEAAQEVARHLSSRQRTQALLRQCDADFWEWVDCRLQDPDIAGMTEQEFLNTIRRPGYTGMKARQSAGNKRIHLAVGA